MNDFIWFLLLFEIFWTKHIFYALPFFFVWTLGWGSKNKKESGTSKSRWAQQTN